MTPSLKLSDVAHCMQRSLAMRKLSLCSSVHLSVRPQNERKFCPDFYTTWKNYYPTFADTKNGWWGRLLLPEILGQADPDGAKTPIFNQYLL